MLLRVHTINLRRDARGFRGGYRVDVRGASTAFAVTDVHTQVQIVA